MKYSKITHAIGLSLIAPSIVFLIAPFTESSLINILHVILTFLVILAPLFSVSYCLKHLKGWLPVLLVGANFIFYAFLWIRVFSYP